MARKILRKKSLSVKEIQKRAKEIEAIGQRFQKALAIFNHRQKEILDRFIKELEGRRIEQIKKNLDLK